MEINETDRKLVLAEHLRTLRVDRGLTLQELAAKSGLSRATLSRIENGEVSPTAETLGRLASAFAVPISQLLIPFLQFTISHIAVSHLSRPIGESSMMVPVFKENLGRS